MLNEEKNKNSNAGVSGRSGFAELLCGCGCPGRYVQIAADKSEIYSCNKHQRCPTYEELRCEVRDLQIETRVYKKHLEQIVSEDGMAYEYKAWAKAALNSHKKRRCDE